MGYKSSILYIGGFELSDKNVAKSYVKEKILNRKLL